MNRKNLIRIFLIAAIYLGLGAARMPYHQSILNNAPSTSYDTYMTAQELLIRTQQANLAKQKAVSANTKLDWDEKLANIFWSTRRFNEALALYKKVQAEREKTSKGYTEKLINTMLSQAGVYRDLNMLAEANSIYEKVWQLDKIHISLHDPRLARDQSNLALISYMRGDRETNVKERQKYFNQCLNLLDNAQIILQNQPRPKPATVANCLYLRFLACRELGQTVASQSYKKQADYLTKTLKRPYVAPWS